MNMPTLLIVDDEKATRDGLRMALEEVFECYVAADVRSAEQILKTESIDVLLTDLRLGGDSGMDVLESAQRLPHPPVAIMMTAYGSVDTAVQAMKRGAYHFVTKPLNLDEVEILLKRAMHSRSLESTNVQLAEENTQLRRQVQTPNKLDRLIGKSPKMQRVFEMIAQVAPTKATVLIEGESGTGKELVAHALHAMSGRPKEKFVIVNCAALSPQLLESELFGHEKGAFTGAANRRIGRFEQADGGTLFLDEIGEIDSATQVKLLRAISERTIERVGSNSPIKVDVRLVTASNKNLRQLVEKGEFREDLYFRLNVVKIDVPALRERAEDIVLLANAFLKEFAKENGKEQKPLSDAALALLRSYSWGGNVRELRTAIEHGVVMSNSVMIEPVHLPNFLTEKPRLLSLPAPSGVIDVVGAEKLLASVDDLNLDALEQAAIAKALFRTGGNRTQAAELLGISRRTLQRKLREPE